MKALLAGLLVLLAASAFAQPAPTTQTAVNGQSVNGAITYCWNTTSSAFEACKQGTAGGTTSTAPATVVPYDLDATTVATAGTAVVALAAGNAIHGGFLKAVSAIICVRESTGAAGTTDGVAGSVCIAIGQTYTLAAQAGAVSVNSATTGAIIGGKGYK